MFPQSVSTEIQFANPKVCCKPEETSADHYRWNILHFLFAREHLTYYTPPILFFFFWSFTKMMKVLIDIFHCPSILIKYICPSVFFLIAKYPFIHKQCLKCFLYFLQCFMTMRHATKKMQIILSVLNSEGLLRLFLWQ